MNLGEYVLKLFCLARSQRFGLEINKVFFAICGSVFNIKFSMYVIPPPLRAETE